MKVRELSNVLGNMFLLSLLKNGSRQRREKEEWRKEILLVGFHKNENLANKVQGTVRKRDVRPSSGAGRHCRACVNPAKAGDSTPGFPKRPLQLLPRFTPAFTISKAEDAVPPARLGAAARGVSALWPFAAGAVPPPRPELLSGPALPGPRIGAGPLRPLRTPGAAPRSLLFSPRHLGLSLPL